MELFFLIFKNISVRKKIIKFNYIQIHEVSDQRKETEPEAKFSPMLSPLGLGTTVTSKELLAHTRLPLFQRKPSYFGKPNRLAFRSGVTVAFAVARDC